MRWQEASEPSEFDAFETGPEILAYVATKYGADALQQLRRQILSKKFVAQPAIRDVRSARALPCFLHPPASSPSVLKKIHFYQLFIAASEVSSK